MGKAAKIIIDGIPGEQSEEMHGMDIVRMYGPFPRLTS